MSVGENSFMRSLWGVDRIFSTGLLGFKLDVNSGDHGSLAVLAHSSEDYGVYAAH